MAAAVTTLVLASAPPAATVETVAAADVMETVAAWEMNEGADASQMLDSSPNGIHGAVGTAVEMGVVESDTTFYRWAQVKPNEPPAKPERQVLADDPRLNPSAGDYAFTMRFRTTHSAGNMIQKGQSTNRGGMFKMQNVRGQLTCTFRGFDEQGNLQAKSVNSGPETEITYNDGAWHVVTCLRSVGVVSDPSDDQVTMSIDGERVARGRGPTGTIDNRVPLSIASKPNCDQIETTCDYFSGDIDYVRITRGAPDLPTNTAPVATAQASPAVAEVGDVVSLSAEGSTDAETPNDLTYRWDFGDGSSDTGEIAQHAYTTAGEYVAEVTVRDPSGATDTAQARITVNGPANTAPTAVVGVGPGTKFTRSPITFTAAGSTDLETATSDLVYSWSFGDGSEVLETSEPIVTKAFLQGGLYQVQLTVTDAGGLSDVASLPVSIFRQVACESRVVHRTGSWRALQRPAATAGSFCDNQGRAKGRDTMALAFTGTHLTIDFAKGRRGGKARVVIDGVPRGAIHFGGSSNRPRFGFKRSYRDLVEGEHRVRVVMKRGRGYLDSFVIRGRVI